MITIETKRFTGVEDRLKEVFYINEMLSNGYRLISVTFVNFNYKYYWFK